MSKTKNTVVNQIVVQNQEVSIEKYDPNLIINRKKKTPSEKRFLFKWYNSPLFLFLVITTLFISNFLLLLFIVQPTSLSIINSKFDEEFSQKQKFVLNNINSSVELIDSIEGVKNENAFIDCRIITLSEIQIENAIKTNINIQSQTIEYKDEINSNYLSSQQYNSYLSELNELTQKYSQEVSKANNQIVLVELINQIKKDYNEMCQNLSENNSQLCFDISQKLNETKYLKNEYTTKTIDQITNKIDSEGSYCNEENEENITLDLFKSEFEFMNDFDNISDQVTFFDIEENYQIQMNNLNKKKEKYFDDRDKYKFYFLDYEF